MANQVARKENRTNLQRLVERGYSFVEKQDPLQLFFNQEKQSYAWYVPAGDKVRYFNGSNPETK